MALSGVAAALVAFLLFSPAAAANGPAFSVVYPTGVFPEDVQNVQAAVNKGGTVFLKAFNRAGIPTAFNFSTEIRSAFGSGFVNLTTDVSIVGEHVGKYQATISGGFGPIQGPAPVKSSIQGLDFESPFDDAIVILASTGTDVIGNVIHNVVPVKVEILADGNIITFGDGVDFFGETDTSISGKVRVIGNVIDGLGAIFSNGIQFDTVGAESEISGNTVRNLNSVATEQGSGLAFVRIQKPMLIANNLIVLGASPTSDADGIFIGGDAGARYQVIGNWVFCDGPNGDGIDIAGGNGVGTTATTNALVRGNHIATVNAPNSAGIAVFDLVVDALIAGNDLHGTGYFALGITTQGFETNIASLNRFIDNSLTDYTSVVADVYFDVNAEHNQEIGRCKTLIDLGVDNSSTCGERRASVGPNVISPAAISATGNGTTIWSRKQRSMQMRGLRVRVSNNQ
jgi:hypothetical protein